ncbi:MAG: hypothetical protein C0597_12520 [Marinilabiliales bacterium]|nr:MAG: hypothetical protein C0597_12520 [Marinilabiliales bacterium]
MKTTSQSFMNIKELQDIYLVTITNNNKINILNSWAMESSLDRLLQKADKSIYIDLKNIQFIDSTGFRTLVKLNNTARTKNVKMFFFNFSEEAFELVDLLGLFNEFSILDRFNNLKKAS